ncbi:MAG: tripartite tricarboxylate transporter substrate-binding protein [Deltaproteobacteria bacterium]|nr:tripartite tricarboxylate transporter substrate-binding protein [Deltaproteobacteria bacterium]MDZ4340923.1 tripartite tricarboxylate transporter substrate-binding protein [Candidatus Binatia bacterium]
MKRAMIKSLACLFLALTFPASAAFAQEPFYQGKTVRIIVGASAGGGYDTYSRTIARHIGKHIAGNPTFVVDNMPGAGFLIAANHIYKVAKPDGLTIGHFIGGLFLQQLLGKPGIEFDGPKFGFIGVPTQDNYVIGISKKTGVTSMDQWMSTKTVVKLGGVGAGSATDDIPKVFMATIGLPVQLVSGFKGTADVRLAYNSGEVQGVCNAWESFRATWPNELKSGDLTIVLQTTAKPHPELPNVPLSINYAKTDEARKLIQALVHSVGPAARPYVLPPGTPKDRVQILRRAFMDTMKDPDFIADATKAKLDLNPLDGAELEKNVREVFNLDAALLPRAKEILK